MPDRTGAPVPSRHYPSLARHAVIPQSVKSTVNGALIECRPPVIEGAEDMLTIKFSRVKLREVYLITSSYPVDWEAIDLLRQIFKPRQPVWRMEIPKTNRPHLISANIVSS